MDNWMVIRALWIGLGIGIVITFAIVGLVLYSICVYFGTDGEI